MKTSHIYIYASQLITLSIGPLCGPRSELSYNCGCFLFTLYILYDWNINAIYRVTKSLENTHW